MSGQVWMLLIVGVAVAGLTAALLWERHHTKTIAARHGRGPPHSLRCRCTVPPTDDPTTAQITHRDCPLHGRTCP